MPDKLYRFMLLMSCFEIIEEWKEKSEGVFHLEEEFLKMLSPEDLQMITDFKIADFEMRNIIDNAKAAGLFGRYGASLPLYLKATYDGFTHE